MGVPRFLVRTWTTIITQFENPDVTMIDHVIADINNTFIFVFHRLLVSCETVLKLRYGQKGELELPSAITVNEKNIRLNF